MITDQYATADELQEIIALLKGFDQFAATLRDKVVHVSTDLFEESDGTGKTFKVLDSNGDVLGHIGYGDKGYVLYFDNQVDA